MSPSECKLEAIRTYRGLTKLNFDDLLFEKELAEIAVERAKQNGSYQKPKFCSCHELVINGERVPCPTRHCCDYVRRRNSLIPLAAARASWEEPRTSFDEQAGRRWTRIFSKTMDELSAKLSSRQ